MKTSSALAWLAGASLLVPGVVSAQVFSGSGPGAGPWDIPDGGQNTGNPGDWGAPLLVTFNVSGLAQPIGGVSLSITMNHSFIVDLDVQLFGPSGNPADPMAQGFVIFSRVGQQVDRGMFNESGSSWRLGTYHEDNSCNLVFDAPATYNFSDDASGDLWATAGFNTTAGTNVDSTGNIPAGGYRTSVAGPWDSVGNTHGGNHNAGQLTSFATDSGFIGLTPAQADGTWTLRIRDGGLNDVGNVAAAELTITAVPEPIHYALMTGLGLIVFAGYRRYSRTEA